MQHRTEMGMHDRVMVPAANELRDGIHEAGAMNLMNPRANAAANDAVPGLAQGHGRRRSLLMLLDIKLALKMVLVVLLLGQDGNPVRLLVLSALAFAAFLYQTGILGAVALMLFPHRQRAGQPFEPGRQADGISGASSEIPPRQRLRGLHEGGIAPGGGIVMDLNYLFLGFLCSLMPTWQPVPADMDMNMPRRTRVDANE